MTLPTSGTITLAQINTEFGRGSNLDAYRGTSWFKPDNSTGAFPTGAIALTDFYGKQSNSPVTPGTQTFSTAGASSFTVPMYNALVIEMWGGGGGGGAGEGSGGGITVAPNGAASTVSSLSLSAGGGSGGVSGYYRGGSGSGGAGGAASGGDTNTAGNAGTVTAGGVSPNASGSVGRGGNGGFLNGGDYLEYGGGGGSGAYVNKTFSPGSGPAVGASLSLVVGAHGPAGGGNFGGGGNTAGAVGSIKITWS
ncbi:MAG: hypothetical protein JWM36_4733 [Hyphomicrobiales bacterium]|nr:hypothetical protein [Hyphomicrobiales bacterium]